MTGIKRRKTRVTFDSGNKSEKNREITEQEESQDKEKRTLIHLRDIHRKKKKEK